MDNLQTLIGKPYPLGATVGPDGVNFAVFSRNGTKVILDLFRDQNDMEPYAVIELDEKKNRTGDIWHVFVPGLKAGALYIYQVDGPFEPSEGHRFNVKQYLFDPCADAITNTSVFHNIPPTYRAVLDKTDLELCESKKDFPFPKCVVVDHSNFDWEGDRPLNLPMSRCIIYEVHTKGFTAGKESCVANPGTYDGFIQKIPYLKDLGITSVELLPIHEFDEYENTNENPRTGERMKNYWGYSTISFYAPKASYAADRSPGGCVNEFKRLVKEMHRAGLEVILDVVFNHTAEGNEHGVTLNFRGFDNSIYYDLVYNHKEYYMNFSGCGNTVNTNHPVVLNYIINCLRHWVLDYHIDGFRFDLASILNRREDGTVMKVSPLVEAITDDPILHKTKMIAEPWDAGGSYQLGEFPGTRWGEWNDRFRDDIRKFWRGDEHVSTGAATRFAGSSDLFGFRKPWVGINYVTCHDGFTMNDLVSYNGKHNEENGEDNRDGTDSNWSYNHGYEGPTLNPHIEKMRNKQVRNYILTLMISQGTPMLLGGDEFRRGQQGNNNAYCQDNDISWFDWGILKINRRILTFTKRAIEMRKKHSVFRRENFFRGSRDGVMDIQWYDTDGSNPDWNKLSRFLAFTLSGRDCLNDDGKPDNDFYIAANSDRADVMVTLPTILDESKKWYRVADTSIEDDDAIVPEGKPEQLPSQNHYVIPANSLIMLMAK